MCHSDHISLTLMLRFLNVAADLSRHGSSWLAEIIPELAKGSFDI